EILVVVGVEFHVLIVIVVEVDVLVIDVLVEVIVLVEVQVVFVVQKMVYFHERRIRYLTKFGDTFLDDVVQLLVKISS
ncbi:hypothetical protein A2U01_0065793, partial [Trifolium medium]|nr:hypothetical protein [Trifolium medium]